MKFYITFYYNSIKFNLTCQKVYWEDFFKLSFCKNPGVLFSKQKWLCRLKALFFVLHNGMGGGHQLYKGMLFKGKGCPKLRKIV